MSDQNNRPILNEETAIGAIRAYSLRELLLFSTATSSSLPEAFTNIKLKCAHPPLAGSLFHSSFAGCQTFHRDSSLLLKMALFEQTCNHGLHILAGLLGSPVLSVGLLQPMVIESLAPSPCKFEASPLRRLTPAEATERFLHSFLGGAGLRQPV